MRRPIIEKPIPTSSARWIIHSACHLLAVAAFCTPIPTNAQPLVGTTIERDGSLGAGQIVGIEVEPNPLSDIKRRWTISESHGARPGGGSNLFHSFRKFELASREEAQFTADHETNNIVVRVLPGPPDLPGRTGITRIEGTINTTTENVKHANLYWLSPDGIRLGEDAEFDVGGALSMSTANSLTFTTQDPGGASFVVDSSGASPLLATAHPSEFGFLGMQRIVLDRTFLCGGGSFTCNRFTTIGDSIRLEGGGIDLSGGAAIRANSDDITLIAANDITLSGTNTNETDVARGAAVYVVNNEKEPGGNINFEAENIDLKDGALIAILADEDSIGGGISLQASGRIRLQGTSEDNEPLSGITLTPELDLNALLVNRLQRGSSDIAFLSRQQSASSDAPGGIRLNAATIELLDGAEVTSFARAGVSADITLDATDRIELSGYGRNPNPGGGPDTIGSMVQSRNLALDGEGQTGNVRAYAETLLLDDAAQFANETITDADAGEIRIEADRIELRGESELRSSSNGPGSPGDVRIESTRLTLSDESKISVIAREGPTIGDADSSLQNPTRGKISVEVGDLVLLDGGSQFIADVLEEGLGGNIEIRSSGTPGATLVLRNQSAILAEATGPEASTRGGDIRIEAASVLSCPDCIISADGPTEATAGSVVINNPVTAIESQAAPPNISYLDASSMLRAQCGSDRSGEAAEGGGFTVARWPGIPLSAEGPLLAFSPLGDKLGLRTAATERVDETKKDPSIEPKSFAAGDLKLPNAVRPETPYLLAMRSGNEAMRGGRSTEAAAAYGAASQVAAERGETAAHVDALQGVGQARQTAGAYLESLEPLEKALSLSRAAEDRSREAAALGALGNAYVALGDEQSAESHLRKAVEVARGGQTLPGTQSIGESDPSSPGAAVSPLLRATLLNNLGNQQALAGKTRGAISAYAESAKEALAGGEWLRGAQANANAARIALDLEDMNAAREALKRARAALSKSNAPATDQTSLRIHLAASEAVLARTDVDEKRRALLAAHGDLLRASETAQSDGDLRAASHSLGALGALYSQEGGRGREARYLTQRAIMLAEKAQAADLLARWHSQLGTLAWDEGDSSAALDAYRRAVSFLEETRPEAAASYGSADIAFRQAVEPVYLTLVDILLQTSSDSSSAADQQGRLSEARAVVEQWKAAELRNYFRDSCAADLEATARSVETIDPGSAVIYPIILPDRLELLVSRSTGIARYTVPVSATELGGEVNNFRNLLQKRSTHQYLRPAAKLHSWLIEPYERLLESEGVETLVFVPGGSLRTVPLGALHDGEHFLIERYAVAITPSLDLLAPKSLDPSSANLLLAGVSESVQGYPALPSVESELQAIEDLYGGEVLLNASFDTASLEAALRNGRPGIVHLASHAEFTGDPGSSFVLTHNDRLSMDELTTLMRSARYGKEPVELLMLSACETARGDERAALGLAGVAVRAGARSAMGSLWSVSDEATSALVVNFYQALDNPELNKAGALRSAQLNLMDAAEFRHPYYWAPFTVINNWL